jgi:prepilin-type N-terminal cleavage/methylation domain-containing protein
MKTPFKHSVPGFTLIELLVTIAIFTFVMVIATGALVSAQTINVRLQQTQTVLDGVNLSTEMIVRDIRYGSNFYCTTGSSVPTPLPSGRLDCVYPSGGSVLVFTPNVALAGSGDKTQDKVAYFLSGGILYKTEFPFGTQSRTYQITTTDVRVNQLAFFVKGSKNSLDVSGDSNQPIVTVTIAGTTVPPKQNIQPVKFTIQTSASTRTLDK